MSAAITERPPLTAGTDDAGAPPRWTAVELLPAVVLAVLGTLLLRRGHGLWFDELFTAEVARRPLTEILSAVAEGRGVTSYLADVPPSYNAPYYLVVHVWNWLPGAGGDTSLRVLSLLATAGGLTLITRAVTRLLGRPSGVLAGTALAAVPLLLEQAVEARSYGLAVLATGGALLGLVRWLQGAPRGLLLLGLAGAGMGLAHWYAVTTLAAFVVAAVLLRGRRAVPVVLTAAAAALPTVALVVVNLLNGTGARNAQHLTDTDGTLADRAVDAWTGGIWVDGPTSTPLLWATVVLAAVGGLRAVGLRVVGICWVLVPLYLVLGAELLRPVYHSRYLVTGLLGLTVLAAAGAVALPRQLRLPAAAVLLVCSLLAVSPVLDRAPRERADDLVRALSAQHRPGEPVVAADQRSAIAVDHYVRTLAPELRGDVVLPPDDAPADAERVWLVRRLIDGDPEPTDDDEILSGAGLRLVRQVEFPASRTPLVLQLWVR